MIDTGSASLQALRAVAGMIDDALVVIDGAGRVAFASPTACEVAGGGLEEQTPFRNAAMDFRLLRMVDAARTGSAQERELTIGARDLRVRATPLQDDHGGVLVVLHDLTRVRHLERVRADFVSNVSHELRTPVTAIRLMAETLQNGGLDDRDAARDFVQRIAVEAVHMSHIVEELLELSAVESGLRPVSLERVAPDHLLEAAERLRPLAQDKGLSFTCTVDPDTPALRGDPEWLGQVVRNLVHNAIKFTPQGGSVSLTVSGHGSEVEFRCADTGIGIRPADQQRVFERFWKADASRLQDGEGSGLGLAIVRHVVEAHGGRVTVASEPRHGTVFTVTIPAFDSVR